MNKRLFLVPVVLITSAAFAADAPKGPKLPEIPAESTAKKKELLFSDDFERKELGKQWEQVVPMFTLENGAMKGDQKRDKDIPAENGKPAVKMHQAVAGIEIP